MAGLDPAILETPKGVDMRVKPAHDGFREGANSHPVLDCFVAALLAMTGKQAAPPKPSS